MTHEQSFLIVKMIDALKTPLASSMKDARSAETNPIINTIYRVDAPSPSAPIEGCPTVRISTSQEK